MGSAQSDALKQAIEVPVSETRATFKDDAGRWRTFDTAQADSGKAYRTALMPEWWTPEQRFAWRYSDGRVLSNEDFARNNARTLPPFHLLPERITADLETGEEVPA